MLRLICGQIGKKSPVEYEIKIKNCVIYGNFFSNRAETEKLYLKGGHGNIFVLRPGLLASFWPGLSAGRWVSFT